MSAPSAVAGVNVTEEVPARRLSRRRRWRWLVLGVPALALVIAGVTVTVSRRSGNGGSDGATAGNGTGTALAEVRQQSLSSQSQVEGALGYAGGVDVVNQASGTVTGLPAVGQIVNQGDILYWVDGYPVLLLYGATPAYRDLAAGTSASKIAGPDVQQLNAALVALGFGTGVQLDPASDQFTWRTKQAVKELQAALGVKKTGALTLGQVVFLPSAIRITSVAATLGGPTQAGTAVLKGTSTSPVVTVELEAARQSEVHQGDAVVITLPNLTTTPGTVSSVGTVAKESSSDSSKTIVPVEITLTDPAAAAGLDQAPVLVSITTGTVDNALVVSVTALLALAGGGYAVEVVDPNGVHHLVPVELGLFDDSAGLVQVTGEGLAAGQQVVIPST
jgi:hypothetical protein